MLQGSNRHHLTVDLRCLQPKVLEHPGHCKLYHDIPHWVRDNHLSWVSYLRWLSISSSDFPGLIASHSNWRVFLGTKSFAIKVSSLDYMSLRLPRITSMKFVWCYTINNSISIHSSSAKGSTLLNQSHFTKCNARTSNVGFFHRHCKPKQTRWVRPASSLKLPHGWKPVFTTLKKQGIAARCFIACRSLAVARWRAGVLYSDSDFQFCWASPHEVRAVGAHVATCAYHKIQPATYSSGESRATTRTYSYYW